MMNSQHTKPGGGGKEGRGQVSKSIARKIPVPTINIKKDNKNEI